jgi:superfamily II DNA or RNA helicase
MIKFELTDDGKWFRLTESSDVLEFRQLQIFFTKKVKNYWLFKKKGWDGEIKFLYKNTFIPVGLWGEVQRMAKTYKIDVQLGGMDDIFLPVEFDEFKSWIDDFFKGAEKPPRDYQIDAAFKIIRYRYSVQELATNAGKTLIAFMAMGYLLSKGMASKFLMIVPNATLVMQAVEDFQEYESHRTEKVGLKIQMMYSGAEQKRHETNVLIGTFHSLVKKEQDFLEGFDCACVDETHQAHTSSIRTIMSKCNGLKFRFGMTGTLGDPEIADYFTIQSVIGPLVNKVSADFLFKNNYATPVEIRVIRMNYKDDGSRALLAEKLRKRMEDDPIKIYNEEKEMVLSSLDRLYFICDMIAKTSKNSLVLFQSVQEGYGRKIFDRIREITNDKEVFYVDGEIDNELREEYKHRMKTGNNKILIASFKTFSTGISISNLHNVFLVESYKSEFVVRQSIGRMMRLHDDKETAIIIDFVDDFSWKSKLNYMMKHSEERIKIYRGEKFPYKVMNIDIKDYSFNRRIND